MNSIRKRLALGLLAGFSLLLLLSGVVNYYALFHTLEAEWDVSLRNQAETLAAAIREEAGKTEVEFAPRGAIENQTNMPIEFYQVSRISGALVRRSSSLGKTNLPLKFGPMKSPIFFDVQLPDGQSGRAVGIRFSPASEEVHGVAVKKRKRSAAGEGGEAQVANQVPAEAGAGGQVREVGLVVASRRSSMMRALKAYRNAEMVTGGILLVATWGLLVLVLRQGLKPLDRLAEQALAIEARSLRERFSTTDLPAELAPITSRLNDLLARLERSFTDLSEHAAKVSHELRTPLTIVRLKLEQAGGNVSPELAEEIQDELHQLSQFVDISLMIAKAEQGRLVAAPCVFDLAAVARDVASDFSMLARVQGRSVAVVLHSPAYVQADTRHARQILRNLLTNALKHGVGEIRVRLCQRSDRTMVWIGNRIGPRLDHEDSSGLGLQVVQTLLRLQPELRYRCRQTTGVYGALLVFPSQPSASVPQPLSPEYPGLQLPSDI